MHGYNRAHNMHANGMHENLCMVLIENTIENYLSPAHTDHYALRKQEQPLPQCF